MGSHARQIEIPNREQKKAMETNKRGALRSELTELLAKFGAGDPSGTPDFIMADYLLAQIDSFNETAEICAVWHGSRQ